MASRNKHLLRASDISLVYRAFRFQRQILFWTETRKYTIFSVFYNSGIILPQFPIKLRSLKQKTKDNFTTCLSQAWITLQNPVRHLDRRVYLHNVYRHQAMGS